NPSPACPASSLLIQSVAGFSCMEAQATGIDSRSGGLSPASMRATWQLGSSERRAAITAPAEPPPTTTKSKLSDMSMAPVAEGTSCSVQLTPREHRCNDWAARFERANPAPQADLRRWNLLKC